jgi:hypothetical protein
VLAHVTAPLTVQGNTSGRDLRNTGGLIRRRGLVKLQPLTADAVFLRRLAADEPFDKIIPASAHHVV